MRRYGFGRVVGALSSMTTAALVLSGLLVASPAAAAAPGVTYLCSSSDYSCLQGSGYAGQSVWGSWGPGHNCVSYAAYRLELSGSPRPWPDRLGSGYEWDEKARAAGYPVDHNPTVGSIAQWDTGSGHVGYVESVTDSYIDVSEDNFSSSGAGTSTRRRIDRSSATFAAADFIHVRDAAPAVPNRTFHNGDLVDYAGNVYRLAGGAPLYISTYDAVGGFQPSTTLTDSEFSTMQQKPEDGTLVVGAQTGQVYRFAGGAPIYVSTFDAFGGPQAVMPVDQAALDNAGAGGQWNHASLHPADGTLIRGGQTGQVYIVWSGHPNYVSDWAQIGGPQPTIAVDQVAIDNAGGSGYWAHLG